MAMFHWMPRNVSSDEVSLGEFPTLLPRGVAKMRPKTFPVCSTTVGLSHSYELKNDLNMSAKYGTSPHLAAPNLGWAYLRKNLRIYDMFKYEVFC